MASAKNHDLLRQWGADHTVDCERARLCPPARLAARLTTHVRCETDKSDVVAEVLKRFPKGVDVVYDCFGGDFMAKVEPVGPAAHRARGRACNAVACVQMVAEGGRVVTIANYAAAQYFKRVRPLALSRCRGRVCCIQPDRLHLQAAFFYVFVEPNTRDLDLLTEVRSASARSCQHACRFWWILHRAAGCSWWRPDG